MNLTLPLLAVTGPLSNYAWVGRGVLGIAEQKMLKHLLLHVTSVYTIHKITLQLVLSTYFKLNFMISLLTVNCNIIM